MSPAPGTMVSRDEQRVLVVEDDYAIRGMLVEALREEGYEVREAGNGREALELLSEWTPRLILLDLMMPVMDGWTFRQEQLRLDHARDIPVVVLTAARNPQVAELKAMQVFPKPFDLDDVLNTAAGVCAKAAA